MIPDGISYEFSGIKIDGIAAGTLYLEPEGFVVLLVGKVLESLYIKYFERILLLAVEDVDPDLIAYVMFLLGKLISGIIKCGIDGFLLDILG